MQRVTYICDCCGVAEEVRQGDRVHVRELEFRLSGCRHGVTLVKLDICASCRDALVRKLLDTVKVFKLQAGGGR